jgi:hypothetical protein
MTGGWALAWVSLGVTAAIYVLELVLAAVLLRVSLRDALIAWRMDLPVKYRPANLSAVIAEIDTHGPGARRIVAKLHLVPDSLFPLAYVTCLSAFSLMVWAGKPVVGQAGVAAAVTGGVADVIENAGIVWMLLRFPTIPSGLAVSTWVFSWMKYGALLAALLVLASRAIVRT